MQKERNEYGEFINTLPRYQEYNGDTYLELHANRTLWEVDDVAEDIIYCELEFVIEKFVQATDIDVYLLGRSGRHVCVEDTPKNSRRYQYLRKIALRLENEFIRNLNCCNED